MWTDGRGTPLPHPAPASPRLARMQAPFSPSRRHALLSLSPRPVTIAVQELDTIFPVSTPAGSPPRPAPHPLRSPPFLHPPCVPTTICYPSLLAHTRVRRATPRVEHGGPDDDSFFCISGGEGRHSGVRPHCFLFRTVAMESALEATSSAVTVIFKSYTTCVQPFDVKK